MSENTHTVTTIEPVDFFQLAKDEARVKAAGKPLTQEEKNDIEELDWSLCLLIECTSFGFDQLIKQLNQAKKYYCTEAEAKIEKILWEKYPASYKYELLESQSDHSGASDQDNR